MCVCEHVCDACFHMVPYATTVHMYMHTYTYAHMQVYALEIQMYTEQKNNKKLKALYEQSLHIKSAIPHPLIMGVIRGIHSISSEYICSTVDREMFAVKKFSPLAQVAKICLRRTIRVTLPAVAKIKHAEIYHAKKKERENFPIYGINKVCACVQTCVVVCMVELGCE